MDEQTPSPTPHNNLFQFGLSQASTASGLIRQMLSAEVVEQLDLSTLTREQDSYIDDALRDSYADMVYSVKTRSVSGSKSDPSRPKTSRAYDADDIQLAVEEALIYFLIEHKSQPEKLTAFQLLRYLVRIWEASLRNNQPLRPIIRLVVYHGETAWNKNRTLAEIVRYPAGLAEFAVNFAFPMLDLCQTADEQFSAQGEPFLQSLFYLLKYGRSEQLKDHLLKIFQLLGVDADSNLIQGRISAVLVYIMTSNPTIKTEDLQKALGQSFPAFVYPGTIADSLRKEGREEGREEGLLIGKIQLLQELSGIPVSTLDSLEEISITELQVMLAQLQTQLRGQA